MRALLIEDDTSVSQSTALMLKSAGYDCDAADLAAEGLRLLGEGEYDVILLDLMLPDMDGYELLQRLRRLKVKTPILILSGIGGLDNKVKGLGFGADDYLTKPFERAELIARVNAIVRRAKGGGSRPLKTASLSSSLLAKRGEAASWSFTDAYAPPAPAQVHLPPKGHSRPADRPAPKPAAQPDSGQTASLTSLTLVEDKPAAKITLTPARDLVQEPIVPPSQQGPHPDAHVIVLGNAKGGTGKSTLAMHLAVALLRRGFAVATLDLDHPQATFSRYLDYRLNAAQGDGLPVPQHRTLAPSPGAVGEVEEWLLEMGGQADFILVDTPGALTTLSGLAHSYGDSVITPVNDSFIDLDMLAALSGEGKAVRQLGPYSEMVEEARQHRRARDGKNADWIVLRNRLSSLYAHNKREVAEALERLAERLNFRLIEGLGERVIYRELFLSGLTLLDLKDRKNGQSLTLSHVAARQELRRLLDGLGLPRAQDAGDGDAAESAPTPLKAAL